MSEERTVKKLTLAELRAEMPVSSPHKTRAIPFRSDILNLTTGGGVLCGFITEMSGMPGMFKSTIAAEQVITAVGMGAHVIIHDKEHKMIESRFTSLGAKNINKKNPRVWYFEDELSDDPKRPPYIITIEQLFTDLHTIILGVRRDDLQTLKKKFADGEASDEHVENYSRLLPIKDVEKFKKAKGKKKEDALQQAISESLVSPSQLDEEDRSLVLAVADSVTAIPAAEEALDPKTGQPNLSPSPATQARVWSNLLRTCNFFDSRVALLHIAQIRTAGIMQHGHKPYKKAAVSASQEFYSTIRLKIFPDSNGMLYRAQDGSILKGDKMHERFADEELHQIGMVISVAVDKNLESLKTNVPIYMIGATGTDVVNSMWEFLYSRNMVYAAGGWYKFRPDFLPEFQNGFRRETFLEIFNEHGKKIWQALNRWKQRMIYGSNEDDASVR